MIIIKLIDRKWYETKEDINRQPNLKKIYKYSTNIKWLL